ncbi:MAG TPA: hypothetical protein VEY89_08080 [Candidatus Dormibacteraeota bacterium]|nr:hypothetical protein [Candidatus Dormibacteraeota bacterium]
MRATLVCVAAALLLGACGESSSNAQRTLLPSAHSPSAAPSGPTLTGTVSVTEAAALSAQFHVPVGATQTGAPAGTTCASYAQGTSGGFTPPVFDVTTNDHSIYFGATMPSGYAGPGTYDSSSVPSLTGTVAVAVGTDPGQQPATSIYRSRISGHSTLMVRPDGSGVFQFSEWGSDEVRGDTGSAAIVSGTVTWSCH